MYGSIRKAKGYIYFFLSLKLHNPTLPIVTTTYREDGQIDVNFLKSSFIPGAKVSHFPSEEIDSELQKINWNELMLLWIYDFLCEKKTMEKPKKFKNEIRIKVCLWLENFCIVSNSLTGSFNVCFIKIRSKLSTHQVGLIL